MKIKTWIKYEEPYLPPRCRKFRFKQCEDYIFINIKEVDINDVSLAFEDNSYQGKGKIYCFNKKLYAAVKMPNQNILEYLSENNVNVDTPLDYLKYSNANYSTYFRFHWDREKGIDTSRKGVISYARKDMRKYILINGVLYERTSEPRYVVNTFGLGHNHGGTGLFCEYHYNPNIPKEAYFNALQGKEAIAYANFVAAKRGDTNSVGKFKPFIICHMPELIKINPNKQHGDGNKLLKEFEKITESSDDALMAGVLCILNAMS